MKTNRKAERDSKKADEQDSYSTQRKTKENKKEKKITPNRWQERNVKKEKNQSAMCHLVYRLLQHCKDLRHR